MRLLGRVVVVLCVVAWPLRSEAQTASKDDYLRYMPRESPARVAQTPASAELHLFGDASAAGYVDAHPKNGIDDRRDVLLNALAVRFAPFMVRNTTAAPMNWQRFPEVFQSFPLYVDTWNVAGSPVVRTNARQVDWNALTRAPCKGENPRSADCLLLSYLNIELGPRFVDTRVVSASYAPFSVMFFDFPGENAHDWHKEYTDLSGKEMPERYRGAERVYVHPFISGNAESGYELALQYWFFYPWNDSANDHEGDWEHINVIVSPRSRVTQMLNAGDLQALLGREANALDGKDPLVIRRIDYYFHHNVFAMDMSFPNAYAPKEQWEAELDQMSKERYGADAIAREVRRRAYKDDAETQLNTHPIAFIGGDSKGPELLIVSPGATNRDSHGTFPFRGNYQGIGPAGATEAIVHSFDFDAYAAGEELPHGITRYDMPSRVLVVPDWERLSQQLLSDVEVRRDWAWLVLPIRWGYPASDSPFAGIVPGADTGNLAPLGPVFNGGWNHAGPGPGYDDYKPHRLSSALPTSALDSIYNTLGFLNIPVLLLTSLPPLDVLFKLGGLPVRALFSNTFPPVFYPKDLPPSRSMTLNLGTTVQWLDEDVWPVLFFNKRQSTALITSIAEAAGDATVNGEGRAETVTSLMGQISFFLSPRLSTETTVRHSKSGLGINLNESSDGLITVRSTLDMWELSGSVRFNLLTERFLPFVRAGYGRVWYRLENVRVNGETISVPNSLWINTPTLSKPKTWLPNAWHVGGGLEYIFYWNPRPLTPSLSLRAEYTAISHRMGVELDTDLFGVTPDPHTIRQTASFSLAVSL